MTNRKRTTLGVVHVTATPPGWDKGRAGIRTIHKAQSWSTADNVDACLGLITVDPEMSLALHNVEVEALKNQLAPALADLSVAEAAISTQKEDATARTVQIAELSSIVASGVSSWA